MRQRVASKNVVANTSSQASYKYLNLKQTLILGVSLALNAMAGGFGASLSGHNPVIICIAIGIFSYATVDIGQRLSATYVSKYLGVWAQKIAGIFLICIRFYDLFF